MIQVHGADWISGFFLCLRLTDPTIHIAIWWYVILFKDVCNSCAIDTRILQNKINIYLINIPMHNLIHYRVGNLFVTKKIFENVIFLLPPSLFLIVVVLFTTKGSSMSRERGIGRQAGGRSGGDGCPCHRPSGLSCHSVFDYWPPSPELTKNQPVRYAFSVLKCGPGRS